MQISEMYINFRKGSNRIANHLSFEYSVNKKAASPLQGDDLFTTQLELVALPPSLEPFTALLSHYMFMRSLLNIGMDTYSTVIMTCGLYYLVLNALVTEDAYIKHSDYPHGRSPGASILTWYHLVPPTYPHDDYKPRL